MARLSYGSRLSSAGIACAVEGAGDEQLLAADC